MELILLGGGGHCLSCIAAIEASHASYSIKGILDETLPAGETVFGYPVLGKDRDLPKLASGSANLLITVGQIHTPEVRKRIASEMDALSASTDLSVTFPVVVAGNASVSHAVLESGTIVMQMAIVNTGARIGEHSIVNNRALVEHGVSVGNFSHIATAAIINGDCRLGNQVFVGSGAVIKQGISIGDGVCVGAGSVVIQDLEVPGWYAGNPARLLRQG